MRLECCEAGQTMARALTRCQFWLHIFLLVLGSIAMVSSQDTRATQADAVALARRTLAAKLSVPAERIELVSVARAEWRDSSLGCPERGMVYQQVVTSGYKVTLRHEEKPHAVHVAGGQAIVCSAQSDAKISSAPLVSSSLKARDAVRAALGARLNIDPARVRIVSARPIRSNSRPCAEMPARPTGLAFVVEAEAEGQTFRYYADDAVAGSCDDPARKR